MQSFQIKYKNSVPVQYLLISLLCFLLKIAHFQHFTLFTSQHFCPVYKPEGQAGKTWKLSET